VVSADGRRPARSGVFEADDNAQWRRVPYRPIHPLIMVRQ